MSNQTARASDVLLRALGGRSVMLRMPAPAVPADPTEQLGLATPTFQDLPLAPVTYRKARATVSATNAGAPSELRSGGSARFELLVSATAIAALVGSLSYASASVLFANACGILADSDGTLYEIISAAAEEAFGQPYVYRLILRAPQAQTI